MSLILEPTPDVATTHIRVGLVIRKPVEIVRACLATLKAQTLPPRTRVSFHCILDTDLPEVLHEVSDLFAVPERDIVEFEDPIHGDFSDDGPKTHHWTPTAMERVGSLKNRILAKALSDHCDAVWLVDADLLCDEGTLKSLWYADAPVCSAVFWTRWINDPTIHAAPQVWLRHPYALDGRGYPDEAAFRRRLASRQLTQVWGLGACMLIRRAVLEAGVSFSRVPDIPTNGMMAGEDRHFCLQCEARHIPMIADPWPHIWHCYHAYQGNELANRLQDVSKAHTDRDPAWVSVRLQLLEPIPTAPGQFGQVAPHVVRARVGRGDLLPDLERQILQHLDGEPFIAEVHYPLWYEVPFLRGQRRLLDVTVIEAKTALGMPVLDDEIEDGMDVTEYEPRQLETLSHV